MMKTLKVTLLTALFFAVTSFGVPTVAKGITVEECKAACDPHDSDCRLMCEWIFR